MVHSQKNYEHSLRIESSPGGPLKKMCDSLSEDCSGIAQHHIVRAGKVMLKTINSSKSVTCLNPFHYKISGA